MQYSRNRKVQCDGQRPACSFCTRRGIQGDCSYDLSAAKRSRGRPPIAKQQSTYDTIGRLLGKLNVKLVEARNLSVSSSASCPYAIIRFEKNESIGCDPADLIGDAAQGDNAHQQAHRANCSATVISTVVVQPWWLAEELLVRYARSERKATQFRMKINRLAFRYRLSPCLQKSREKSEEPLPVG